MKTTIILGVFAACAALTGCLDKDPPPQPKVVQQNADGTQTTLQEATPAQDHTVRDMAIGAAGGYLASKLLGGGGSSQAAPPVQNTTTVVQRKTVIVNNYREPPKSPVAKPVMKPSRPSFTSRPSSSRSGKR